jgi:hypothetical protein
VQEKSEQKSERKTEEGRTRAKSEEEGKRRVNRGVKTHLVCGFGFTLCVALKITFSGLGFTLCGFIFCGFRRFTFCGFCRNTLCDFEFTLCSLVSPYVAVIIMMIINTLMPVQENGFTYLRVLLVSPSGATFRRRRAGSRCLSSPGRTSPPPWTSAAQLSFSANSPTLRLSPKNCRYEEMLGIKVNEQECVKK